MGNRRMTTNDGMTPVWMENLVLLRPVRARYHPQQTGDPTSSSHHWPSRLTMPISRIITTIIRATMAATSTCTRREVQSKCAGRHQGRPRLKRLSHRECPALTGRSRGRIFSSFLLGVVRGTAAWELIRTTYLSCMNGPASPHHALM